MEHLPLAEIENAYAVQQDESITIVVDGYTSGFGGKLVVYKSNEMIFPPAFYVYEMPGNPGINPSASPTHVPTTAATSFPGRYAQILLISATDRRVLKVTKVAPAQPTQPTAADKGASAPAAASAVGLHAVLDKLPPEWHIRVTGVLMMPTPGYKLTLTKAEPQGTNPRILLLNLKTERPNGFQVDLLTPTPVSYDAATKTPYEKVQIEPGHIVLDADVINDPLDNSRHTG